MIMAASIQNEDFAPKFFDVIKLLPAEEFIFYIEILF